MVNNTVRVQRIAPPARPECLPAKAGYIKVRLCYLTFDPKHMRSQMLRASCGAKAPYSEDVCILLPRMKVFPEIENYEASFERLQITGVISPSAKLTSINILDEDDDTLSYLL